MLLLRQKFPEPEKLVADVFKPFSGDTSIKPPVFYLDKSFGNSIYKGKLEFQWPHAIKVSKILPIQITPTSNLCIKKGVLRPKLGLVMMHLNICNQVPRL